MRLRRRGSFPQRHHNHLSTSVNPNAVADLAPATASVSRAANCAVDSAAALASASSPSILLSSLNHDPEHVVASMLLNEDSGCNRGDPQQLPPSPATSVSSDTAPGWAERAGLAGGVTAACTASSPMGKEATAINRLKGDRDVPRFLRPVVLLLTLSLMAIVGARVGRGIGMYGPAVHAAGGVQLPEAVVDDIFDRADKDHDGVIADKEIQYVSVVPVYKAMIISIIPSVYSPQVVHCCFSH